MLDIAFLKAYNIFIATMLVFGRRCFFIYAEGGEIVRREKNAFWKSGTISALSLISFVTVLLIILAGNIYMNLCIENEAAAQKNRYELKALGESLADASDYLTDEVRKYAVTGEIEHLYNYWYEVEITKRRDNAINTLISYNPPQKELYLLREAKKYSDILIETEAYSMKMVLLANKKTAEDYSYNKLTEDFVKRVMSYELPDEYKALSPSEMKEVSISILYDKNYENAKYLIMNPIETFQNEMNARLNRDVAESTEGRVRASAVQITCLLTGIIFIGILLFGMNNLYIRPLKDYTKDLNRARNQDAYGKFDLSMVQVAPKGAYELWEFGRLFNSLSKTLQNEFEKREKAEEEMRMARDEATRANNAKSEFLARMSHELRTPLNAIIGYLYLLNESISDERQKRYCESIWLSSENLLGLISDILDFAKIESGKMTFENADFDMISLIREVCSIMENSARQKKLAFRLEIEGDIPKIVKGDLIKLRQILINLIGNAVKFTHEGMVELSVKLIEQADDFCRIEFAVKDTGIGIKEEDKKKIFEPFVQSDASITRKYGGTGLGLAICKMIVEGASGGEETIELISEEGKGSCFKFRMKFGMGNEKAAPIDSKKEFLSAGIGKKVLLVDDNEINLEVESEIIKSFGMETEMAQSGREALEKSSKIKFDMIIMDIRMPDMDGYEVTSRIRKMREYKFTPIIALSADAVAGVSEKALEAGVNCYVSKPLKPEKLIEIMAKYFNIAQNEPEKLDTGVGGYFNFRKCLKNLNGNEALLVRLAQKFVMERKNDAEHVKFHIKDKNFGNARHILHDITGLSGNLCCDELCKSAKRLGEQLAKMDFSALDDFLEIWDKTMGEINDYIASQKKIDFKSAALRDSQKILNDFAAKCRAYDVEAAEIFEANQKLFKDFFDSDEYEKIKKAVAGYDFETAAQIFSARGH
jgi:hypothetical protein